MEEKKTEQENETKAEESRWREEFNLNKKGLVFTCLAFVICKFILGGSQITILLLTVMLVIFCGQLIKKFPVKITPKVFLYETGITKELYQDFNFVRGAILMCLLFLFTLVRSADFSPSPKESASLDSMVERPASNKKLTSYQQAQLENIQVLKSELNDVAREAEEFKETAESMLLKFRQDIAQEYRKLPKDERLDLLRKIERQNDPKNDIFFAEFAKVETDPEIYREAIRVLSALTGLELSGDYDKKDETIEKVKPAVEKDWDASRSDDDKERN